MKRALCALLIVSVTGGLVGCGENPNTTGGTLIGAAAGGLLGSQFGGGSGKIAGAIIGATAGGLIGNKIGQYMDQQDKMNQQSAMEGGVGMGQSAHWSNQRTGANYTVTPVKQYNSGGGRLCRQYRTTIVMQGKKENAFGEACQDNQGNWHIQK